MKKVSKLAQKRALKFSAFLTDITQFLNRLIKFSLPYFPIFDKKIT
jgi:hypothetical protein